MRTRGLVGAEPAAVADFLKEVADVERRTGGTHEALEGAGERLESIKKALMRSTVQDTSLDDRARALLRRVQDLHETFDGNERRARFGDPGPATISSRLGMIGFGNSFSTYGPTAMHLRQLEIVKEEFADLAAAVDEILSVDLPALEADLDAAGVPWSPGRGVPGG